MDQQPTDDIQVDDVIQLRKPHPCGGNAWQVVRIGGEIGLRCIQCGRRALLPRSQLRKRLKAVVGRAAERPGAVGDPARDHSRPRR